MNTAFIFDFDGTLVDSEQAIYHCFQTITTKLAPERIEYAKNILIGPPLRDTASEILGPEHQGSLEEFVQLFIKMHDDQVIQHTQPYPNVINTLEQLYAKKIPMGIATNKRLAPTQKLINHFGWQNYFRFIECCDSDKFIRKKGMMIQAILKKDNRFIPSYFVGDTVNDGLSANKNNLKFIRAKYGYGKAQNWKEVRIHQSINEFSELKNIINVNISSSDKE